MQGVSGPIKCALVQVGVAVSMKPHFTLSSVFRKPKDARCDEKKCGLVYEISCCDCDAAYEISCCDCDAAYVAEIGRSLNIVISQPLD